MRYGKQIGSKFNKDGTARRYPGNTVIADIKPGSAAYAVLQAARQQLLAAEFAPLFIPLPEESYHMTVIRGLNDLVRERTFWPAALEMDAEMDAADQYVARAVKSVANPGPIRMAFAGIRANEEDLRVLLRPANERQQTVLRDYRDRVADALSVRLPGHSEYTFHITLAYTLWVADGHPQKALTAWLYGVGALLDRAAHFDVDPPHLAYYENMLRFLPARGEAGMDGGMHHSRYKADR